MTNIQKRSASKARSELIVRRAELARIQQRNERDEDELRPGNEPGARSSNEGLAEVLISLSESERKEVLAIDAAIGRIDQGTWGLCTQCAGKISVKRLSVIPEATSCLECQSALDTRRS